MKVKVLGPLAVCVDGVCLDLGGPLQQRVLAVLLTHRNAPVSRRRLIAEYLGRKGGKHGRA